MVNSKNKNLLGAIVVIALIVAVIVLTTIASASAKTYAEVETADYYKVKIGDTVWATVESEEDAQKITDKAIKDVDAVCAAKEKEIMEV